jgi:hypothetical protein
MGKCLDNIKLVQVCGPYESFSHNYTYLNCKIIVEDLDPYLKILKIIFIFLTLAHFFKKKKKKEEKEVNYKKLFFFNIKKGGELE